MQQLSNLLQAYKQSAWHQWWLRNVWQPSWSNFLTFLYGIPAALVAIIMKISDWAKDDTVTQYLAQIGLPNWVPSTLAVVALVYYIAHGRD